METDSLLLDIETEDVYADKARHANFYDTSDYPPSHPLHSVKNKKVLGKMKDDMEGEPIAEVVCLRPKMYSILRADDRFPSDRSMSMAYWWPNRCSARVRLNHLTMAWSR